MQVIGNIPGLEGAYDMELAGAIHRVIDLWVLGKLIKSTCHASWPGIESTDMTAVEDQHGILIFFGICGAMLFVMQQGLLYFRRQLSSQTICFADPLNQAGRGIGYGETGQAARLCQGILHTEHTSP